MAFGLLGIRRGGFPAEFLERRLELARHVAPFPHAGNREEILATGLFPLAAEQLPELQQRQEIRALVGEPLVPLVGRGGALERALTRILHRERGGDDARRGEAALVACRDQHACDPWIER